MSIFKGIICAAFVLSAVSFAREEGAQLYFIKAKAADADTRSKIANAGLAIDGVLSDSVTVFGTQEDVNRLKSIGIEVDVAHLPDRIFDDFPSKDSKFHNFQENIDAIDKLVAAYPDIATKISIGESLEGRDLAGVRLSGNPDVDSLPTAVFMGCHHAREHLSVEVPLRLAQQFAEKYATDARIRNLLDTREVYFIPMINPDGAEYDIAGANYRYWRKNRRPNGDGTFGVDLNRNYAKNFGGQGSSSQTHSDIFHGPHAFSEPETQAVRDFLRARKKTTVLISFHTFSELILWPWGHTKDPISNMRDRRVFETMGRKMATWNGYKPQKSSALYVASGDTTDWAYDELGIFAYTFELTPSSFLFGGFYPGAKAIDPTVKANAEPVLYLIDKAEDPYSVLSGTTDPLGIL